LKTLLKYGPISSSNEESVAEIKFSHW